MMTNGSVTLKTSGHNILLLLLFTYFHCALQKETGAQEPKEQTNRKTRVPTKKTTRMFKSYHAGTSMSSTVYAEVQQLDHANLSHVALQDGLNVSFLK